MNTLHILRKSGPQSLRQVRRIADPGSMNANQSTYHPVVSNIVNKRICTLVTGFLTYYSVQ